ncbi:50S ribosomal protein L18 [Candidatus Wolfebacteria bacterium]|nr:50S ribosomal protein L18 [Candidatus Wolfebacteria bacterium]
MENKLNQKRARRAFRTRAKIRGTAAHPRLAVFRSNRYTAAQLIDDEKSVTIVGAMSKGVSGKPSKSRIMQASALGELVASKAKEKGVDSIVFDRGRYKYHGRVKALAEGLRKGGLKF